LAEHRVLQFTVLLEKAIDGIDASIPSIRECATWARTEEEALVALVDRLAFFLHREPGFKHHIDYMRREDEKTWYKLIIRS
jgi:predicted RNase H-like HicB family nuclease